MTTTRIVKVGRAGSNNTVDITINCGDIVTYGEVIARAEMSANTKIMTYDGEVRSVDVIPSHINKVLLAAPKIDGGADCDRTFKVGRAGSNNTVDITIRAGDIVTYADVISKAGMSANGKLMSYDGEVRSVDTIPDHINKVLIAAPKIDGGADCDRIFRVGKAGSNNTVDVTIHAGDIVTYADVISRAGMSANGKLMSYDGEVRSIDTIPDHINKVLIAAPKIDGGNCN